MEKLEGYLDSLGLQYCSVEEEDRGYDFEVAIGEEKIYVELKSSSYRWDGWEYGLTRNEFLTAEELGDNYFLCIIDRVLDDDYQIYFIKDPAGQANGFLFDDPWQETAIDMDAYVSSLRNTP